MILCGVGIADQNNSPTTLKGDTERNASPKPIPVITLPDRPKAESSVPFEL